MEGLRKKLTVLSEDVETLNPGYLVNGIVVNGYLRLIERRSIFKTNLPKVWCFDTTFMSDWHKGRFNAVRARVRDVELFEKDLVFFPIHLPQVGEWGHWSLILVRPKTKEICEYDSIGYSLDEEMNSVLEFFRRYAKSLGLPMLVEQWKKLGTPKGCPKQERGDQVSCGAFVCAFAEMLSRKVDVTKKLVESRSARRTIASILRKGRFGDEDFSLAEPEDSKTRRYAAHNQLTPVASIDLCTPDGRIERCIVQDDPLLHELNEAIDGKRSPWKELFPPLVKTETATLSTIMETDESSDISEQLPPSTIMEAGESQEPLSHPPADTSTGNESPCLTQVDMDLEEEFTELQIEEPTVVPMENSAVEEKNREQSHQMCRLPPDQESIIEKLLERKTAKPVLVPTPQQSTSRRERLTHMDQRSGRFVTRSATGQIHVRCRNRPQQRRYFAVPEVMQRRLADRTCEWTPRQQKNQKWKVTRPDGTQFRIRSYKLKRLQQCY